MSVAGEIRGGGDSDSAPSERVTYESVVDGVQ